MNQLEEHDDMIRKSERILLLKTISQVFYSLDTIEQMRIYINHKLDDESNKDKKIAFNKGYHPNNATFGGSGVNTPHTK